MEFCGIDEAGRGPLAGPVVVSAVIFGNNKRIEGVKDSKKLSPLKREYFYEKIINSCQFYRISIIDNKIIDSINILRATMLGIENCICELNPQECKLFIDGNYFKLQNDKHKLYNYLTIVKGDEKIFDISCASIIAKVTRDRIMKEYHEIYPQYGFLSHKGYATKNHIEMLKKYGICEIHRKTFCKNYI